MLTFFFHRNAVMVRLMEVLGLILATVGSVHLLAQNPSTANIIAVALVALLYVFLRICATKRFYRDAPHGSGIELQFTKAVVPLGYLLTLAGIWLLISPRALPLWIVAAIFIFLAHVNVILITLHHRDRDPTPVNAFSGTRK